MPLAVPIGATEVLLLAQVPPGVAFDNARELPKQMELPPGYTWSIGGATKDILDTWGEDGWELVQVLAMPEGNLVAYLASDYAAYVTGAVMGVGLDD